MKTQKIKSSVSSTVIPADVARELDGMIVEKIVWTPVMDEIIRKYAGKVSKLGLTRFLEDRFGYAGSVCSVSRRAEYLAKTGILLIFSAFLSGCMVVSIKTKTTEFHSTSLFRSVSLPVGNIASNGDFQVRGYQSETDGEAIGTMIGTAIKVAK